MSHNRVFIDQCIRPYFSQGLTQAETALRLSVRDNIQISTRHKEKTSPADHRQSHFSDAAGSDLDWPNLCDHEPHVHC